jgi:uncharacterized membrane protein YkvA (DUF1232 family)
MNEVEERYLDAFAAWLKSLKADALLCAQVLEDDSGAITGREHAAGALSYLFKSLDLIPDGIEDLGFIDDAFVLRVSAALASASTPGEPGALASLAEDSRLILDFLGPDYARLETFTRGLKDLTVRGRSVAAVVSNPEARRELIDEVKAWAASYEAPSFTRDEKNLVKLKAFLGAKLPS